MKKIISLIFFSIIASPLVLARKAVQLENIELPEVKSMKSSDYGAYNRLDLSSKNLDLIDDF